MIWATSEEAFLVTSPHTYPVQLTYPPRGRVFQSGHYMVIIFPPWAAPLPHPHVGISTVPGNANKNFCVLSKILLLLPRVKLLTGTAICWHRVLSLISLQRKGLKWILPAPAGVWACRKLYFPTFHLHYSAGNETSPLLRHQLMSSCTILVLLFAITPCCAQMAEQGVLWGCCCSRVWCTRGINKHSKDRAAVLDVLQRSTRSLLASTVYLLHGPCVCILVEFCHLIFLSLFLHSKSLHCLPYFNIFQFALTEDLKTTLCDSLASTCPC